MMATSLRSLAYGTPETLKELTILSLKDEGRLSLCLQGPVYPASGDEKKKP